MRTDHRLDQILKFATTAIGLARREITLLSVLLVIAGSVWIFLEIADEVVEGEIDQIDRMIFLAFRDPADIKSPLGPPWLHEAALEITALGSFAVLGLITIAVIIWVLLLRQLGAAVLVAVSVLGGVLISSLLKTGFARARPDLVPHADVVHTMSFPSGHAMSAAVVYLTLAALLARAQEHRRLKLYLIGVAVTLTVLVGLSRVYLGVHWPSDVIAGWSVGSAWALMCWAVALWWQRRGKGAVRANQ